jgi:hypothetical protein
VGKAAESRIIWNELLELELHDVDEQVTGFCTALATVGDARIDLTASPYGVFMAGPAATGDIEE